MQQHLPLGASEGAQPVAYQMLPTPQPVYYLVHTTCGTLVAYQGTGRRTSHGSTGHREQPTCSSPFCSHAAKTPGADQESRLGRLADKAPQSSNMDQAKRWVPAPAERALLSADPVAPQVQPAMSLESNDHTMQLLHGESQ